MTQELDYRLSSYDYELDQEAIAQYPSQARSASRLLVLERQKGSVRFSTFEHLA
ncbi:MAG: S-adenosylmethionine:tRNA ribosyltransferase-isomerase, partial [Desulfonatronovibrionaceae bacterium]